MIKHIVWWTLKEEAEGAKACENAVKMMEMLKNLEGRIPALLSIEVSTTFLHSSSEDVQVILQTSHNTPEDLQAYAVHPEHIACVEFIKNVVSSRKAIDYIV